MQQQIWGEVVDFNLAFFSSSGNVTVKTLLKSVNIYQSYCKKNLAQFFLAHPVRTTYSMRVIFANSMDAFARRITHYVKYLTL